MTKHTQALMCRLMIALAVIASLFSGSMASQAFAHTQTDDPPAATATTEAPTATTEPTTEAPTITTEPTTVATATTVPTATTAATTQPTATQPAATATTAPTKTPSCSPGNDLSGKLNSSSGGSVTNGSTTCSYDIGIASYRRMDNVIDNQQLYASNTASIGPGETVSLSVGLPDCAAQVDLFYGPVLDSLKGRRYGSRLLDNRNVNGERYCGVEQSTPTTLPATSTPVTPATATAVPTTTVVPTTTTVPTATTTPETPVTATAVPTATATPETPSSSTTVPTATRVPETPATSTPAPTATSVPDQPVATNTPTTVATTVAEQPSATATPTSAPAVQAQPTVQQSRPRVVAPAEQAAPQGRPRAVLPATGSDNATMWLMLTLASVTIALGALLRLRQIQH